MGTVRIYCTEQVALFLVHALGLGGKLLLAALFGIPMRPQAGRIEGENSGAVRSDDHDGHWAQHPASAEETETAAEGAEFVFGWGTDYTHYFIGFVLLYVCAACCGGCCGLCVIWEINASISVCVSVSVSVSVSLSPSRLSVLLSLCTVAQGGGDFPEQVHALQDARELGHYHSDGHATSANPAPAAA